ncbi:MAG: hypothetical protein GY832_42710 [Chloroflexi bacterium]|nr:hypothetical protein [Chloroflexota bacterium]
MSQVNKQIVEWAHVEKEKRSNQLFFPAVHSALSGAWDDVRKDLRRGRITLRDANDIADKFLQVGKINDWQCHHLKGRFASIAEGE